MAYVIDLNEDRCVYTEIFNPDSEIEERRCYEINKNHGHLYRENPLKISVGKEVVNIETLHGSASFPISEIKTLIFRGSLGNDYLPLTDLSFEATIPTTLEIVKYEWPRYNGPTIQIFPNSN